MLLEIFKDLALIVGILFLCIIFIALVKSICETPKKIKEDRELDEAIKKLADEIAEDLFKNQDKEDK